MVAPGSASVAWAVIPTAVPVAAFSATLPPVAPSVSVGPTTGVVVDVGHRDRERLALLVEPSLEVARTVMAWLVEVSASSSVPFATVTTPVAAIDRKPTAGVIAQRVADGRAQVRIGGHGP